MESNNNTYYQGYINEYKNSLELLKKRKALQAQKKQVENERAEKLLFLQKLMKEITVMKYRKAELVQIEETIKRKTETMDQDDRDISEQRQRCHDKQMKIMHLHKVINTFRNKFTDELRTTETKYQDLNSLEIIYASRQRAMLFELGSYLFNEKIAGYVFNPGMLQLIKEYHQDRREKIGGKNAIVILDVEMSPVEKNSEISTSLGYCVILLNALSKYLNVPLKFPMCFSGSMSWVLGKQNETYPLCRAKVYDKQKFNSGIKNLLQNIMQIFEYCEVDISKKKPSLRKIMETLIKILQGNYGPDLQAAENRSFIGSGTNV